MPTSPSSEVCRWILRAKYTADVLCWRIRSEAVTMPIKRRVRATSSTLAFNGNVMGLR